MSYSTRGHPQQAQYQQQFYVQPQQVQTVQYEHSGRVRQHPYQGHQGQQPQLVRNVAKAQLVQSQRVQVPMSSLPHNGQNNHNQQRCAKVPLRELPSAMPEFQHPVYPQLYTVRKPASTCYKWDCIILDLDRTIIHGKRLSVKRWRKYVENGTIPSLAENQCSKWHRHIHRRGHQMHPFIRGRTMIYYRPFTWHLLAVLDYLKSHFGTKIIVCTKAGEHYAASVLAALISNFTSANPDLIDDVYNFHDLHDDPEEEGKPKKPFGLICDRHHLDPAKTLIVDDNATSWFGADRKETNFWMPPCYGYQIHDIDNELQLLCKYLWDPVQQNHLKKKTMEAQAKKPLKAPLTLKVDTRSSRSSNGKGEFERVEQVERHQDSPQMVKLKHVQHSHSHNSVGTDRSRSRSHRSRSSSRSPKREIISRNSPKSVSAGSTVSPNQRYLNSPHSATLTPNGTPNGTPHGTPKTYPATGPVQFQQSISYSTGSSQPDSVIIMSHNHQNNVELEYIEDRDHHEEMYAQTAAQQMQQQMHQQQPIVNMKRISRGYSKRKFGHVRGREHVQNVHHVQPAMDHMGVAMPQTVISLDDRYSNSNSKRSPRSPTKKKKFFESKSRGSKKMVKIIGK